MEEPKPQSPWHAGEIALQGTVGVAARMAELGPKVIRDHMPEQHRLFFAGLSFVIIGSVSIDGAPFATLVMGAPGFVGTSDEHTLTVRYSPHEGDPHASGFIVGAAIGLLGIEFHTRRRNRVNGRISRIEGGVLTVAVEQSFGNCPKYIQLRETVPLPHDTLLRHPAIRCTSALDPAQRALVRGADTMFVATYVDLPQAGGAGRQVDVSHRGGRPGFISVSPDGVLTISDFSGNRFFNTLGNIALNPRAGLLFVDFAEGKTLRIEGYAEIVLSGEALAGFRGAERLWRVHPRAVYETEGGSLPLEFQAPADSLSPFLKDTGTWPELPEISMLERPSAPPAFLAKGQRDDARGASTSECADVNCGAHLQNGLVTASQTTIETATRVAAGAAAKNG